MGALVIVTALLLPVAPFVIFRSHALDSLTDRLKRHVFESAPMLLYTAVWLAAVFALLGAAVVNGVGVPAAVAFGAATFAILFVTTREEDIDVD